MNAEDIRIGMSVRLSRACPYNSVFKDEAFSVIGKIVMKNADGETYAVWFEKDPPLMTWTVHPCCIDEAKMRCTEIDYLKINGEIS